MLRTLLKKIRVLFSNTTTHSNIDPDEIFLDSTNLPQFNTSQFEGRIEKPISKNSLFFIGIAFLIVGLIFSSKIWVLQVTEGEVYAQTSENNRLRHQLIFADRGIIYDRNNEPLVLNVRDENDSFSRRKYNDMPGLSHVLGYVNYPLKDTSGIYYQKDFIGKDGIEKLFDTTLRGINGLKIIETDALMNIKSESTIRPLENGNDLVLSIDSRVQSKLYEYIKQTAESVSFEGGAGVFMNIHTGEILALTSYPEYDSSVLSDGKDSKAIAEYILDVQKPFLNRIISGLYTPGSIIKPYIAIGALNEGIIDPEKSILSTGSITIPNPFFPNQETVFRDWKAHGWVTMREALAVSSNVYFFSVGGGYQDQKGLGISKIEKYMKLFGFGKLSDLYPDIEQNGTIPSPKWKEETFDDGVWRIGDTYNTAIGQYGFQVTPIQVVRAVGAIANNGTLVNPTLILGGNGDKEKIPISEKHFEVVREGMRLAVTSGTAKGLFIPAVAVAAKTGTAELGKRKELVNSWITGFFPYENPQYAFVVIMERGPSENLIGGLFVVRQLLDWMAVNTPEYFESVEL